MHLGQLVAIHYQDPDREDSVFIPTQHGVIELELFRMGTPQQEPYSRHFQFLDVVYRLGEPLDAQPGRVIYGTDVVLNWA